VSERMPAEGDAGPSQRRRIAAIRRKTGSAFGGGKPCRTEAEPRSGRMLPGRKQDGTGQEAG